MANYPWWEKSDIFVVVRKEENEYFYLVGLDGEERKVLSQEVLKEKILDGTYRITNLQIAKDGVLRYRNPNKFNEYPELPRFYLDRYYLMDWVYARGELQFLARYLKSQMQNIKEKFPNILWEDKYCISDSFCYLSEDNTQFTGNITFSMGFELNGKFYIIRYNNNSIINMGEKNRIPRHPIELVELKENGDVEKLKSSNIIDSLTLVKMTERYINNVLVYKK